MNLFLFKYGGAMNGKLRRLVGLGEKIGSLVPGLKYDLTEAGYGASIGEYVAAALANSLYYSLVIFLILSLTLSLQGKMDTSFISELNISTLASFASSITLAIMGAILVFLIFLLLFLFYPRIEARKVAENIDKDLIYALKDLQLQISSGVPLFDALANIARSDYGRVSLEFEIVVREINAGGAEDSALEKLARSTKSEFMRKTIWQMLASIRGGSSLESALKITVNGLNNYQRQQIKGFTGELNIMALLFMLIAVAIPGLGSTLLIVLSSFGGIQVNELFYISLLSVCFFAEMILIGFIKARRPAVHM